MSITFNLVPSTAAASAVYVEQEAVSRGKGSAVIPHKIVVLGQYNSGVTPTANTPQLILNEADAWTRYGRGSLLAAMIKIALDNGGGVPVYAIPLADGGGDKAAGKLVVTGSSTAAGTLAIYIGGKKVSVAVPASTDAADVGDLIEAAINADLDLPVTASDASGTVTITTRWAGESGNQILLEINRADSDATPAGIAVAVTDIGAAGGTVGTTDPTLTTALANMIADDNWYTSLINPYISAASLTAIEAAGVSAADPAVKQMFASFTGYTDTVAEFITALGSRNSEWTTYMPVPGSPTPAYMIAAAAGTIFARYQQSNPGRPIKNLTLPGVIAGNEKMKTNADTIVLAGGSWTVNQSDDTVTIGDAVTTRTTTAAGADTDDWRFTIIIGNLQFKIYALNAKYLASPYDRAVVLADGGGRGPTYGITPNMVKADAIGLVDDWVERGLSTDRDNIVDNIEAAIDSSNPGRINLLIPDVASAGLRVLAAKLEWGFVV